MRKTSVSAKMRFIDVTALGDATPSSSDNQQLGNFSNLKKETRQLEYGTYELNQFVLDGSKRIIDQGRDITFWSKEKSDDDCNISAQITVTFSEQHTSNGITLYFVEEYPRELMVEWYSLAGTKLEAVTFYPDELSFFCKKTVQNYGKIVITFKKTQLPQRYIKLSYILYGVDLNWVDEKIKSASVYEELDPTSRTISINTANLVIVDETGDFDVTKENGAWSTVQKTQKISLSEIVDDYKIEMGTFYVDDFSFGKNIVTFRMIDAIGLMDAYRFITGNVYKAVKAGVILEQIFAAAGITTYSIENDIYNTVLNGFLRIQTCREALQMVCIACNCCADASRGETVRIFKPQKTMVSNIGIDRKFIGTEVSLDEYVSGVLIKSQYINEPSYIHTEADEPPLFSTNLSKGLHVIELPNPSFNYTVSSNALIIASGVNFVKVNVITAGEVSVWGSAYDIYDYEYLLNVEELEAGQSENVKEIGTLTLTNVNGVEEMAQSLLDYYSLRKKVKLRFIMDQEKVGDWVGITNAENLSVTFLESNQIDLTGGFISTTECKGYSKEVWNFYYCGEDIYTGSEMI